MLGRWRFEMDAGDEREGLVVAVCFSILLEETNDAWNTSCLLTLVGIEHGPF